MRLAIRKLTDEVAGLGAFAESPFAAGLTQAARWAPSVAALATFITLLGGSALGLLPNLALPNLALPNLALGAEEGWQSQARAETRDFCQGLGFGLGSADHTRCVESLTKLRLRDHAPPSARQ